jgi:prolipoprotein diacylglyceryltransferase
MIKKMSLDDFLLLACILITIAPIAIMLWRFWNYLNQELYWLVVAWDFRWLPSSVVSFLSTINIFHVYPNVDESLRVNTNFLSIIFEWFLIFLIVVSIFIKSIKRKNIKPYFILWVFFVMYSFARFMIEYLRIDSQSQYILMFTKSQRIFIVSFVIGVFMLMFSNRKELDLS